MKSGISVLLIMSVLALAGPNMPITSSAMTASQLSAAAGMGFWGGSVCGLAGGAVIFAGAAIIGAAGAGTTIPFAIAFAFSAGAHVSAVCLMI